MKDNFSDRFLDAMKRDKEFLIKFNEDETTTNSKGGKQSIVKARYDLIPPTVIRKVSEVLGLGAIKYGVDNWKLIPTDDHLNHALAHIYLYLEGNKEEPHLYHAICRLMFAAFMSET